MYQQQLEIFEIYLRQLIRMTSKYLIQLCFVINKKQFLFLSILYIQRHLWNIDRCYFNVNVIITAT